MRVVGLVLAVSLGGPVAAQAGVNTWTSAGPVGGRVRTIAIDPASPATVYAGTFLNGVFKTTDGGLS